MQSINGTVLTLFNNSVYIYHKESHKNRIPMHKLLSPTVNDFPLRYEKINKRNVFDIDYTVFEKNDEFKKPCLSISPRYGENMKPEINTIQDIHIINHQKFFSNINIQNITQMNNLFKNKRIISKILKNKKIKHTLDFTYHNNQNSGLYCYIYNDHKKFYICFKINEILDLLNDNIYVYYPISNRDNLFEKTDYTLNDFLNNFDDLNESLNLQNY